MAFLLCTSTDWSDKLIYLHRPFYEAIHRIVERGEGSETLAKIAYLDYDGELVLRGQSLVEFQGDLDRIKLESDEVGDPCASLGRILRTLIVEGRELAIGGDMHPVLRRTR